MNTTIIELNIFQFSSIYLLLLIVLFIMKRAKINEARLLLIGSLRMSIQLYLCGLVLTYIFKNPHPLFVILYLAAMILFSIHRVLSKNKSFNASFKKVIVLSIALSGTLITFFFVSVMIGVNFFNPQYTIPIAGMIIGNSMSGMNLALKTLNETMNLNKNKIESLLNAGATPDQILKPFLNTALETALIPTLNSMISMGIISLPGMMTGQILSGTLPMTAILYQIAIMIAICTGTALATFSSLYIGYKTFITPRKIIEWN